MYKLILGLSLAAASLASVGTPLTAYGQSGFGQEFEGGEKAPAYVSPFRGIRKVAIVPFFSLAPNVDPAEFSRIFAGQVENYPGWEVIYPQMVQQFSASQNKSINSSHDAISIARQLGCDGVILGEIRDFDPYYPPKMVIKVSLYRTDLHGGGRDVMNLMRQGIAQDSSVSYQRGEAIYSLSESYDTAREHVMNLVKRYAARFDQSRDPMKYDLFLRVKDRFFEAISFTVRQDMLFAQQTAAAMEKHGPNSKEVQNIKRVTSAEDYRTVAKEQGYSNREASSSRRSRRSDRD